jgi:hypothetical protein
MTKDDISEDAKSSSRTASPSVRTPPYISFKTFQTLLDELKTNGVPPQIDRSVLQRFAGGVQGQLMSALKSLVLIDDNNRPTDKLIILVRNFQTDKFKPTLENLLRESYPYIFNLDLMNATPAMFAKAFSDYSDAKEDVLRKSRTFFLHAAKEIGIPLGSRIENAKFPRSRNGGSSRRPKHLRAHSEVKDDSNPNSPLQPSAITEKALEYRLVDLMTEAVGDTETMAAIIKVITFLKTREADTKNKATDQG